MEGKDKPDDNWIVKVEKCKTPDDFLTLFRDSGIAGDRWKKSKNFLKKGTITIEKGCSEINLSGLVKAIQIRFNGYRKFAAWMEGKDKPDDSRVEAVNKCKTPDDFLKLFNDLGIPEVKWQSHDWMQDRAKLPVDQGGIGKSLAGFIRAIREKFGGYPKFVAWMDGRTMPAVPKIETPEDAIRVIREQALALGITPDELLNPEAISLYIRKNPALKEAISFFK